MSRHFSGCGQHSSALRGLQRPGGQQLCFQRAARGPGSMFRTLAQQPGRLDQPVRLASPDRVGGCRAQGPRPPGAALTRRASTARAVPRPCPLLRPRPRFVPGRRERRRQPQRTVQQRAALPARQLRPRWALKSRPSWHHYSTLEYSERATAVDGDEQQRVGAQPAADQLTQPVRAAEQRGRLQRATAALLGRLLGPQLCRLNRSWPGWWQLLLVESFCETSSFALTQKSSLKLFQVICVHSKSHCF